MFAGLPAPNAQADVAVALFVFHATRMSYEPASAMCSCWGASVSAARAAAAARIADTASAAARIFAGCRGERGP